MTDRNAITDTTILSILRYGATTLVADAGETLTNNVGLLVASVDLKYQKVVGGVCVEMTQGEKDIVDAQLSDPDTDYHPLLYPPGSVETLSSDGAISLYCYASKIDTNNLNLTLADGNIEYQGKLVQTLGGSSCTVICTLESPYVSFTLAANNKSQMMWHTNGGISNWVVIDSKVITFNT